MTDSLAHIGSAMTAAFLASLVEAVEVLAVATVRGWRPAGLGALAGLTVLVLIVAALGPLLGHVPLRLLQFAIGVLLLLFGMRWLRKAILRSAGVIPLHDEAMTFATERQNWGSRPAAMKLGSIGSRHSRASRQCCSKGLKWYSS